MGSLACQVSCVSRSVLVKRGGGGRGFCHSVGACVSVSYDFVNIVSKPKHVIESAVTLSLIQRLKSADQKFQILSSISL